MQMEQGWQLINASDRDLQPLDSLYSFLYPNTAIPPYFF